MNIGRLYSFRTQQKLQRRSICAQVLSKNRPESSAYDWKSIENATQSEIITYQVREGHFPSSVPEPVLESSPDTTTTKDVLFYRDSNGQCPFCQRVWVALKQKQIDYDTVLVVIGANKPQWYKDLVPSGQTPAAVIKGELVSDSLVILKKLEDEFPDSPSLLPTDPDLQVDCDKYIDIISNSTEPYMSAERNTFLVGGKLVDDYLDQSYMQQATDSVLSSLDAWEEVYQTYEGDYFLGQSLTLLDIMLIQPLMRVLQVSKTMHNVTTYGSQRYPGLTRWKDTMDATPAYSSVASDAFTVQSALMRRQGAVMSNENTSRYSEARMAARREAAGKLARNRRSVIHALLEYAGLKRRVTNKYGPTVMSYNGYKSEVSPFVYEAVEYHLGRLANYLITGDLGQVAADTEARSLGVASVAFVRALAQSPRDMSAAAAEELREACVDIMINTF